MTPSLNQGNFIEDTILSVLGQNYPNLEYIILDGGSSDQTVEIIKRYESRLSYWDSGPDNGQADAINQGFARATGEILGWLNADDLYLPGTLGYVARQFRSPSDPFEGILFGNSIHMNEERNRVTGSRVPEDHASLDIELCDYIIQPSSFWTRATWEGVGPLTVDMKYVFDWDWFIRAKRKQVVFQACKRYLSVYRIHPHHKTAVGGSLRRKELAGIYRAYRGEPLAEAFEWMCRHRDPIQWVRIWLHRTRLGKLVSPGMLLRAAFLKNLTGVQVDHLMKML